MNIDEFLKKIENEFPYKDTEMMKKFRKLWDTELSSLSFFKINTNPSYEIYNAAYNMFNKKPVLDLVKLFDKHQIVWKINDGIYFQYETPVIISNKSEYNTEKYMVSNIQMEDGLVYLVYTTDYCFKAKCMFNGLYETDKIKLIEKQNNIRCCAMFIFDDWNW